MKSQKSEGHSKKRFFGFLVMLYVTVMLADQILLYRQAQVGPFYLTAGVFTMPFYYFIGDMIAELYGYTTFRKMLWAVVVCSIIFALIITTLNLLPTPAFWHNKEAYTEVTGRLLRSTIGGAAIAVVAGSYTNGFIISRWKTLAAGRFFFLRSIGSSAIGEAIQMVIGCLVLYLGVIPIERIFQLMWELYIVQIGIGVIIATPGTFIVDILKRLEGGIINENSIDFNPFK